MGIVNQNRQFTSFTAFYDLFFIVDEFKTQIIVHCFDYLSLYENLLKTRFYTIVTENSNKRMKEKNSKCECYRC